MSKKIRTERKVEDYNTEHTTHSHILARPGTYVGSISKISRDDYIFDFDKDEVRIEKIDLPEAVIRIALEIFGNVADNSDSSRRMGVDAGDLKMWIDDEKITVRSRGEPIPIVPKQEKCTKDNCFTIIDQIFGVFLTGSNYDEKIFRMGGGCNGIGAKATNVFSKEFTVKVGDSKRGQEHISIWKNNMKEHVSSITTPGFFYENKPCEVKYKTGFEEKTDILPGTWVSNVNDKNKYKGESYVEVSWILDFNYFGYEKYPDNAKYIFAKYLIDFSLTSKIPVSINDKVYDYRSIHNYASVFFTKEEMENSILHYEWGNFIEKDQKGEKILCLERTDIPYSLAKLSDAKKNKAISDCKSVEHIPVIEMLLLDTPDNGKCLSYVNGLMTKDGGVHVNEALDKILHKILDIFNEKKNANANVKSKDDGIKKIKLNIGDVRPHLSIILTARLPDPQYTSQSKTELSSPTPKYEFSEKFWENMRKKNWDLFDRLEASLTAKKFKEFTKGEKSGRRKFHGGKGENANFAGGPKSLECILALPEGDSGQQYVKTMTVKTEDGCDYIGFLPLKGKPKNATDCDIDELRKNEEFENFKKMSNLCEGLDYTKEENLKSLNYGFFLGAFDADVDGSHIGGLFVNYLFRRFPSILQMGMFGYLVSPRIKIVKSKGDTYEILHRFYSEEEFTTWVSKTGFKETPSTSVMYYKGLGSSEDVDIIDDLSGGAFKVVFVFDDTAGKTLDIAFNKKFISDRKEWIEKLKDVVAISDVSSAKLSELLAPFFVKNTKIDTTLIKKRTITNFINTDLIEYILDVFKRSIPNSKDGLKNSQRQALYYFLKTWNYGTSEKNNDKLLNIIGNAITDCNYHHGNDSMAGTIIKMAQNYVGSNNMNYFKRGGQFGSRDGNVLGLGKDCSQPRYLNSSLEWWIKYIYKKEIIQLIPKNVSENDNVEPKWIPAILPMHIINGAKGVATGHNTAIPNHHPLEVAEWIIKRCKGERVEKLMPWYLGFKGVLKFSEKKIKIINEEDFVEEEQEEDISSLINFSRDNSFITEGLYEITNTYKNSDKIDIHITELPIGISTKKFKSKLDELVKEKKLTDWTKHEKDINEVSIKLIKFVIPEEIHGEKVNEYIMHILGLRTKFSVNNMKLIDENGFPISFKSTNEIMDHYFNEMLNVYNLLIESRKNKCLVKIQELNYLLKLTTEINCRNIIIIDEKGARSKQNIRDQVIAKNIPIEYISEIKIDECTSEDIEHIKSAIFDKEEEIIEISKTIPENLWIDDLNLFIRAYEKKQKETKKGTKKETKK